MMARSRTSAKKAGARFETEVANYLAANVDDRIERRAKNGVKDRCDISGLRHMGGRVVIEWMMGLPAGWVTDVPGLSRTEHLRLLGNGAVPHQASTALQILLSKESMAQI